ncbi:transporter substrate-binding domain-containing protein [Bradyrhizobium sp. USDA 4506]
MRVRLELRLLLLLTLAGYSLPAFAEAEDPLFASIRKAGQVKVELGVAPPYVVASPDGKMSGYAIDVIDLVLHGMKLPQLTPVPIAWDAQLPALQAHQMDFLAFDLISDARCKRGTIFSAPYFAMQDALYVLPRNPKRLMGYSHVAQNPDVKLAVTAGSSQEAYALSRGIKPEQLVRVPDVQAGAATVLSGRADAFALGQFTIASPAEKGLELVVDEGAPMNARGVAFRKENVRFRDAFNEQLNLLRSNGRLKELYAVKYGFPNFDTFAGMVKASDVVPSCE